MLNIFSLSFLSLAESGMASHARTVTQTLKHKLFKALLASPNHMLVKGLFWLPPDSTTASNAPYLHCRFICKDNILLVLQLLVFVLQSPIVPGFFNVLIKPWLYRQFAARIPLILKDLIHRPRYNRVSSQLFYFLCYSSVRIATSYRVLSDHLHNTPSCLS